MRAACHLLGIGIVSIGDEGDPSSDGPDPGEVMAEVGKGQGFIVVVGGGEVGMG